jgi:hypothetical protein
MSLPSDVSPREDARAKGPATTPGIYPRSPAPPPDLHRRPHSSLPAQGKKGAHAQRFRVGYVGTQCLPPGSFAVAARLLPEDPVADC